MLGACVPRLQESTMPVQLRMKRSEFEPAYLRTYRSGALQKKIAEALAALEDCTLCPRDCHVNRLADQYAVCRRGGTRWWAAISRITAKRIVCAAGAAAGRFSFLGATYAACSARTTT